MNLLQQFCEIIMKSFCVRKLPPFGGQFLGTNLGGKGTGL